MTRLAKAFASACLSLALMAGVSFTLTGCSADSLSGPGVEAFATGGGGGGENTGGSTTGPGSDHNTDKVGGGGGENTGGSTTGPGSDHNTDG